MNCTAETYSNINPAVFCGGAAVVDYYGANNDNYVAGEGFCCGDNNLKTKSIADDSPNYEKLQYYYHSDHLGSASYITNLDGEVVQHIEYVPFGEVFLEEHNNTWNTPFLFNGKELDEETGLYYYGARYYNPRISLWYGVDPLAEKYPGVSAYAYCVNNPVMLVDPDGREMDEPELSIGVGISFGSEGFKANLNLTVNQNVGDFTASYGLGVTYHSDFFNTGKSGTEFRNSFMLNYDDGNTGAGFGTNIWTGTGDMKEFNQRTGMVSFRGGDFSFSYENDGTPFSNTLGDGGDSFRTAAASIGFGDASLNMNLFTGLRNKSSFNEENAVDSRTKVIGGIPVGRGQFGENYNHGFVFEKGTPYRYGGATLNYRGLSAGVNSEWVRHAFQNVLAHDIIKPQRQFQMLSNDWKPVLNFSNQGTSKFTIWGQ